MKIAGGSPARLYPVDGRDWLACGSARQSSRGIVDGHLDTRQLRRTTQKLASLSHRASTSESTVEFYTAGSTCDIVEREY